MTDLHLDHFLYLFHSCTHYYQSRGFHLAQGPWKVLLQDCTAAHYQSARRLFSPQFSGPSPISWLTDCTGSATPMMAAFFPVEKRSFSLILLCTYYILAFTCNLDHSCSILKSRDGFYHFFDYQTVRGLITPLHGGFEFVGACAHFLLPDCTGANTLMMAAFFPVENDPFRWYYYTLITLLHSLRLRQLLLHTP